MSEILKRVMDAKDGPTAIAEANKLVEEGLITPADTAPLLRKRVVSKFGNNTLQFSVRVSLVWYDYKAAPSMKLAALTWAVTQDLQGTAEKDFQGRLEMAEDILNKYPAPSLNHALGKILTDNFYLSAIANDYRYLIRALDREVILPKLTIDYTPPKVTHETYEPVPYDLDTDVWAKARLENVKRRDARE